MHPGSPWLNRTARCLWPRGPDPFAHLKNKLISTRQLSRRQPQSQEPLSRRCFPPQSSRPRNSKPQSTCSNRRSKQSSIRIWRSRCRGTRSRASKPTIKQCVSSGTLTPKRMRLYKQRSKTYNIRTSSIWKHTTSSTRRCRSCARSKTSRLVRLLRESRSAPTTRPMCRGGTESLAKSCLLTNPVSTVSLWSWLLQTRSPRWPPSVWGRRRVQAPMKDSNFCKTWRGKTALATTSPNKSDPSY